MLVTILFYEANIRPFLKCHLYNNKELIYILLDISLSKIPKSAHTERYMLCNMASVRDESIRQSSKSVYHVEGFCLYIFGIIKTLMERPSASKQKTVVKKRV